jgi:hypothetical protein
MSKVEVKYLYGTYENCFSRFMQLKRLLSSMTTTLFVRSIGTSRLDEG